MLFRSVAPLIPTPYNLTVSDAYGCASDPDQAIVTVNSLPPTGNTVTGNVSYAFGTCNEQMHDVAITLTPTGGGSSFTGTTAATGQGNYSIPGVTTGTYWVKLHSDKPWGGVTSADITAMENHYRASRPVLLQGIKRLAGDVYQNSTSHIVNVDDRNAVNNRMNNQSYNAFPGDWVFTKTADIAATSYPIQYSNDNYNGSGFTTIKITVDATHTSFNYSALCYGDVNASNNGLKVDVLPVYDGTAEDWFNLFNYPNPFAGKTTFSFEQSVPGNATIRVYNMMGKLMATLGGHDLSEGKHEIVFDAAGYAPGVYVYTFTLKTVNDVMIQNGKLVIMK